MLKLDVPLIPDKTRPAAPVPLARPLSLFGAWRAVRENPLSVFTADAYKVPIFFLGRVFRGIAFINDPEAIERVLVVPDTGPAPDEERDYEKLLAAEDASSYEFPTLDERTAATAQVIAGRVFRPTGSESTLSASPFSTACNCPATSNR